MLSKKPQVGDKLQQPDKKPGTWKDFGTVVEIGDSICHVRLPNGRIGTFIWKFKDELNTHFRKE